MVDRIIHGAGVVLYVHELVAHHCPFPVHQLGNEALVGSDAGPPSLHAVVGLHHVQAVISNQVSHAQRGRSTDARHAVDEHVPLGRDGLIDQPRDVLEDESWGAMKL